MGGGVNITQTSQVRDGRNLENSIEDSTENFIKSNEVAMELPFGTTLTVSGRNLDNEELDLKLHFGSGNEVQGKPCICLLVNDINVDIFLQLGRSPKSKRFWLQS